MKPAFYQNNDSGFSGRGNLVREVGVGRALRTNRRCCRIGVLICLLLGLPAAPSALAAARLLAEDNIIHITDYPAGAPCTLTTLFRLDRMNDWGRIHHDAATATYTVNAHLWIGDNDGTETYFQVGRHDHPAETLVVNGHLVVHPYHIKEENPPLTYQSPRPVNRLTLGCPADPFMRAALKFVGGGRNEHTLYIGAVPGRNEDRHGGELHVYNSMITVAITDNGQTFGAIDTAVGSQSIPAMFFPRRGWVYMTNAVISRFRGVATWGARGNAAVIENTCFEHGGWAMINPGWPARGCTFRNLDTAVGSWGGPLTVTLTDCRFEQNRAHWQLTAPDSRLILMDCTWDAPLERNRYRWNPAHADRGRPPRLLSQRHVIVAVTDTQGVPVTNAAVTITADCRYTDGYPSDEDPVILGRALTSTVGRTPGRGEIGALCLTEFIEEATALPDTPQRTVYTYAVAVKVPGRQPGIVESFTPTQSWQTLKIVLAANDGD